MLIWMQIRNEKNQVRMFQYMCLQIFQKHLQATMYHTEHTSHDIGQYY